jgi:hypothetical protein
VTPARRALMAKIKKCLALSQSANEHEAALALQKARALMAEHGVSAEDLKLADVSEADVKGSGARMPARWETILASAVGRALNCRVIHIERYDELRWIWACRWQFVGTGASPDIAAYAWAVLYRQLRRQRQAYIDAALRRCKPARKRERADIFCQAWAVSVRNKVEALKPSSTQALLIDNYIAARGRELTKLKDRNAFSGTMSGARADDYWRGRAAGEKAELNAGVGGRATPLLVAD